MSGKKKTSAYDRDKDEAAFHLREATEFFLVTHREGGGEEAWIMDAKVRDPPDFRELMAQVAYYTTHLALNHLLMAIYRPGEGE